MRQPLRKWEGGGKALLYLRLLCVEHGFGFGMPCDNVVHETALLIAASL